MTVCAATNNPGKLRELRRILQRMGHEVKSLQELGIDLDPDETGATFAANAALKAAAFCAASGLPTVADDSGLCVAALDGAPGVYSARYAGRHGDDAANNQKLLAAMQAVPAEKRAAKFVSAVCFRLPDGRQLTVTGECPGHIAFTETGHNGFGYDPLFVPDAVGLPGGGTVPNKEHRSYAELADGEKDAISHRGRALAKLAAQLPAFLEPPQKRGNRMMLTSKQRAALRGAANRLDPAFQIGKGEIDDAMVKAVGDCLAKRELVKLSLLETSDYTAKEAADILAKATGAECVQVIGRRFVLFRRKAKPEESAYAALLAR